jgi:HTH-type transcriptional regulator/antitoxin HigA
MSTIRPIRTDDDYQGALLRVEEIFQSSPDTDEGDELEVLTTLISAYEDQHFPIEMPDALSAIRFRMEQQGLSQSDLKPYIGSSAKVSEVLSGRRPLTLKMIRALHQHLDIPAEVLIRGSTLPTDLTEVEWEKFPIREMQKRGWIGNIADAADRAEEIMRSMIERAGGKSALCALYRKNDDARKNANVNPYALKAWCLYVIAKGREADLTGTYTQGSVTLEFLTKLVKLSTREDGPKAAQEFLSKNGIALIPVEKLSNTHLDGAAMMTIEGRPVIGMTLRYDRIDNFWFCLLHELAHIGRHIEKGDSDFFVDNLDIPSSDKTEEEANEWASKASIPERIWNSHPISTLPNTNNVIGLAHTLKIHPAIVAGRVRFLSKNYQLLTSFVGNKEVRRFLRFL